MEAAASGRGGDASTSPGAAHRIHNTGAVPLVFVEVQHGDYFGEDDIVRLEDDHGRLPGEHPVKAAGAATRRPRSGPEPAAQRGRSGALPSRSATGRGEPGGQRA